MNERNAVYEGQVAKARDPKGLGRVQVSLPTFEEKVWAGQATLSAGSKRGTWFAPAVGDEVLVAFANGDPRRPVVVGALWNAKQPPPESNPDRTLVKTKHGTTVVVDDGTGAVEVADGNGNAVKLAADGVTVRAAAKVKVTASSIEIEASVVDVNAAMAKFSGVVECQTLVAQTVVDGS
jgi:phage baseplate assembly protein V